MQSRRVSSNLHLAIVKQANIKASGRHAFIRLAEDYEAATGYLLGLAEAKMASPAESTLEKSVAAERKKIWAKWKISREAV